MKWQDERMVSLLRHPAPFIGASILLGELFAFQEWVDTRRMGSHVSPLLLITAWGFHFFMWGGICWILGTLLRQQVERAGIVRLILGFLPLSIVLSVAEEMLFVFVFHLLPTNRPHMGYWQRVTLYFNSEFIDNMVIIWCAFFAFRAIGYYERFRQNEQTTAKLAIQLANAQLSALRMQLNPHFLFNTMNSISSLMRSDIEAADTMLEQLSCLMRITLERGDAQMIPLRDEMEFIETYLAMQAQRYSGRVDQFLSVDPELYDALVPSMLLQPIVENAFMHGLSKINTDGELSLAVQRNGDQMDIAVVNTGVGLDAIHAPKPEGHGVGLSNIKSRLKLHYGESASFSIAQLDARRVQVSIHLPLQFSDNAINQPMAMSVAP
jgi:two-component system LytT family sensor kinase